MSQSLESYERAIAARSVAQRNFNKIERGIYYSDPGPTAGPPTTGTWALHELYTDSDHTQWRCTAAGTPGTWVIHNASGGSDLTYTHVQDEPSDTWTIVHTLGKHPSVSVVDSANRKIEGEVEYPDVNTVVVRFLGAFSGKAYLN